MKHKTFKIGGSHPTENKFSSKNVIETLPVPEYVTIMTSQHIGAPAEPIVVIGDEVKVGQLIAKSKGFISANIHSSVSGKVEKIDKVLDSTGYKKQAIIIKVEGDTWHEGINLQTEIIKDINCTTEEIKQKVSNAGIVGLGGAAFPSHVKLSVPEGKKIEHLLINGVECEPYLTSDHRLMLEKGEEILIGIRIVLKALNLNKALVGIESNKPDAIKNLEELTKEYNDIEIVPLKTQYPQGGEKQLIKALTGREVPPPPALPLDVGCAVLNVATIYAIYEAVQKNKPLIERVVCVTGKSVKKKSNFLVRIGTSVETVLEAAGGVPDKTKKILSGGPMMGKAINSVNVPTTKGMSGLVLFDENEAIRPDEFPCVRCAKCVSVCPFGLEPYLLSSLAKKGLHDRAEAEGILNCCECACCQYTCPAYKPLLDYIRLGKANVMNNIRNRNNG